MPQSAIVYVTRCVWIGMFPALIAADCLFLRNGYGYSGIPFVSLMVILHLALGYSWFDRVFLKKDINKRLMIGGVALLAINFIVMTLGALSLVNEKQFSILIVVGGALTFFVRGRLLVAKEGR